MVMLMNSDPKLPFSSVALDCVGSENFPFSLLFLLAGVIIELT